MIKVILIDDEKSIVEGMGTSIEWEKHGYELVACAYDGKEGYEKIMLYKPEVVIADITMPGMTGIELAEKLSKELPEVKVILLTCHEDFCYARQAIRLNICEYMVKHTMTREELYHILERIKKEIETEVQEKEKDLILALEINKNKYVVGEILINELLCNQAAEVNEINNRLKIYGYKLDKPLFIPAILRIDNYNEFASNNIFEDTSLAKFVIINVVGEILEAEDIGEVFSKDEDEYILIFNYKADLRFSILEKIKDVAAQIQKCLKKIIKYSCTIYLGCPSNDIKGLGSIYMDLKNIEESGFFLDDESIVSSVQNKPVKGMNLEKLSEIAIEYANALSSFSMQEAEEGVDKFVKVVREYKIGKPDAAMTAQKFFRSIIDQIRYYHCVSDKLTLESCLETLKHVNNVNSLKVVLVKYTEECIKLTEKNAPFASNPEIARIVEYVNKNLDKDINLDSAAKYICMNSSYFSRFFKSKTGENFVDFLSRARIEKAKKLLLNTSMTVDAIAEKVGHTNKAYFSKVFKKMTGVSPGEYKRMNKLQ